MVDVALYVNGVIHRGWQSVTISRALDSLSGNFTVAMTERLTTQSAPLKIAAADAVQVRVDNQPLITGYIDSVNVSYDDRTHSITVSGRDKTADLIDCSAPSQHFVKLTLQQIAEILCQPYGISVINQVDTLVIDDVKNEEGETVFEMLEKLARANNVLLTTDGLGNLLITQGGLGLSAGTLQLGKNIKAGSGGYDFKDRYSLYIGKGSIPGNDEVFAESAAQITGQSIDAAMPRYRPLTILPEEALTDTQITARMQWESNVRAARSIRFQYTVKGWFNEFGQLWRCNDTVRVIDPFMGLDDTLLIGDISFVINDQGVMAVLSLMALGAFTPDPVPTVIKTKQTKRAALPDEWLDERS